MHSCFVASGDWLVFKFLRRSVDGKRLIHFRCKNTPLLYYAALKFLRHSEDGASTLLSYPYFVQLGLGKSARLLSRSKRSEKTSEYHNSNKLLRWISGSLYQHVVWSVRKREADVMVKHFCKSFWYEGWQEYVVVICNSISVEMDLSHPLEN